MAGDIVYADVKIDRTFSSENSSSLQKSDPHHHGIFLKVGCAMIVILCVTVIVLSVLVIQFKSARLNTVENESKEKFCTGKNKSGAITSTEFPVEVPKYFSVLLDWLKNSTWKGIMGLGRQQPFRPPSVFNRRKTDNPEREMCPGVS
ncbi:uncharacterized protein LOC113257911 isoform X2 [Ursus arctos]|uniref:uncharacterized protein LOC113257911 isoform X2 n=1 Tax=Ursus arctos TaxID=9644 RepID=UPI00201706F3|nr:uncharacterized protein LOC113257911 isoform X2 [Ursus arctos]